MRSSKSGSDKMVETKVDTVDIRSSAGQGQETRPVQIVHQLHPPAPADSNSGGGVLASATASIASAIQSAKDAVSGK
ncbi:hypothetical protein F511_36052 [Dorcoceras hygrometricum]|uniref:Uncharacterized protein n=1 Tax=Dorcoceras hygrometricum TaxID=472368 RepID=A0A2Z7C1J8_9LAMI|nr:hypothetical protein F511_36052 [Dorcoceras hygrometricum]